LYIRDSVDERIYEKEDWDRLVGLDRNRYFTWNPPDDPIEVQGPPRAAVPRPQEINVANLEVGDPYPGWYDGLEFSANADGNVADTEGRIATNPQHVPEIVTRLKGQPGRFRVTAAGAILVRVPGDVDGWTTLYGGQIRDPFQFTSGRETVSGVDISKLVPGDPYPGPIEPAQELRFRQRAGGVIARRIRGGDVFARGANAERLIRAVRDVAREHRSVSTIYINDLNHAFWRDEGTPRWIVALDGQVEFPSADSTR
jgi:hypothetical protein